MEHELSARGPSVDLLGERGEADSARLEVVGQSDEVAEASAQTVQPPHNQRIAFAQRLQAGLELAEFERNLIRERTLAGLKAARARGRNGGRPKKLSPKELGLCDTGERRRIEPKAG